MTEQSVERDFQTLGRRCAIRNCDAEERLGTCFVAGGDLRHRPTLNVGRVWTCQARYIQIPASEDTRQPTHVSLTIGFYRNPGVRLGGTIGVELNEPNGKELHDLASIVFVGANKMRRIWFAVS